MKIHADKAEGPLRHAVSISQLRRLLKAVPAELVSGISDVRLSNSTDSAPRVFFCRYSKTLTVHSCGSKPGLILELIVKELAASHLGYATRHWHRLSALENSKIKKMVQPLMDELRLIVVPKVTPAREYVYTPTPEFRRVI